MKCDKNLTLLFNLLNYSVSFLIYTMCRLFINLYCVNSRVPGISGQAEDLKHLLNSCETNRAAYMFGLIFICFSFL